MNTGCGFGVELEATLVVGTLPETRDEPPESTRVPPPINTAAMVAEPRYRKFLLISLP
jgi:hypothetical protein